MREMILPPAPTAPSLLAANSIEKKLYWDRSHYDSPESQMRALALSSTLYIGNLAFSTRVSHLRALFSTLGPITALNMGLDRNRKTPCGFAFLEYEKREDALNAVSCFSGCKLDERIIRVELDAGFKPGRQFGRGSSGGQVRDDRRGTLDRGRAGSAKGKLTGRAGSNRWQAPQKTYNSNSQDSQGSSVGTKRARESSVEDGYQYGQPSTKNPRFRDDD